VDNRRAKQFDLVGQGNPSMGHPLPPKKTSFLPLNPRMLSPIIPFEHPVSPGMITARLNCG
jgi:hypothetical protein